MIYNPKETEKVLRDLPKFTHVLDADMVNDKTTLGEIPKDLTFAKEVMKYGHPSGPFSLAISSMIVSSISSYLVYDNINNYFNIPENYNVLLELGAIGLTFYLAMNICGLGDSDKVQKRVKPFVDYFAKKEYKGVLQKVQEKKETIIQNTLISKENKLDEKVIRSKLEKILSQEI